MALYQPSNITPSSFAGIGGGVVDANDSVRISWQVNGTSPMIGEQISIYTNDAASTPVWESSRIFHSGFWGTDEFGNIVPYIFEPGITWADAGLANGASYKMLISQIYPVEGADSGNITVEQNSPSVFITRAAPTLSILPASGTIGSVTGSFTGQFIQAQGDFVTSVRWILRDGDEVLEDTGTIYTGKPAFAYDGFFSGRTYTLTCEVISSSGVTVTAENTYVCSYESASASGGLSLTCNPDDSVTVTWGIGADIPGVPSAEDYGSVLDGVLHLAASRSVSWSTVNGEDMSFPYPYALAWKGKIGAASTSDSSVPSGRWEEYDTESTVTDSVTKTHYIDTILSDTTIQSFIITTDIDVSTPSTDQPGKYEGTYIRYPGGNEINFTGASLLSTTADDGNATNIKSASEDYVKCVLYDSTPGTYSATIRYNALIKRYYGSSSYILNGYRDVVLKSATVLSTTGSNPVLQILSNNNYDIKVYGTSASDRVSVTVKLDFTYSAKAETYRSIVTGTAPAGAVSAAIVSTTADGGAEVTLSGGSYTVTFYHSAAVSRTAVIRFTKQTVEAHSGLLRTTAAGIFLRNSPEALLFSATGQSAVSVAIPEFTDTCLVQILPSRVTAYFFDASGDFIGTGGAVISLREQPLTGITVSGAQDCDYIYATSNLDYNFYGRAEAPVWDGNTLFYASFAENLQGGTLASSDALSAALYRRSGTTLTPLGTYGQEVSSLTDWGIRSLHEYSYVLYYISSGTYSSGMMSDSFCRAFRQYTLIEAEEDPLERNVFHPVSVWKFRNNIEAGAVSNGNTPALLENFTKYPLWQPSAQAPRSGTLTALLSYFSEGEYLRETAEDMDTLYALSSSPNPLFLRDMKGNLYMVRLSGPVTQTQNIRSGMLEVTVSVPWIEVGDASDVKILETGE